MTDRAVTETSLTSATPADPREPHLVLWNTATYYALRPGQVEHRLCLDHHDVDGRLVGSMVVGRQSADANRATAGFGAPFGGPDLTRAADTVANAEALIDHTVAQAVEAGIDHLEVRAKPAHYGPNEAALMVALVNRRFQVTGCDVNAYLDLGGIDHVDDYVAGLKPSARKELRRSERQGLRTAQVPPSDATGWAEAYDVLRRNREDRGRPMRLPLDYVEAIRDAFPGRVRLLVVEHEDRIVAAALVYRVLPRRDLVQYWGDAGHALPHSPMNPLVRAVVEHALASGSQSVDIGISSEDGVVNHGLVQFKRSVGCSIEPRFVLQRTSDASG